VIYFKILTIFKKHKNMIANKKNLIIIVLIAIILAIAVVYLYQGQSKKKETLSFQSTAEKAISYINQNLLGGEGTASLVGVTEVNGVLKINLKIAEKEYNSYVTKDGKILFPDGYEVDKIAEEVKQEDKSVGDFLVSSDEVCKENGKPLIYFFGSEGCPHCQWEHPIVEKVLKSFEGEVSFHNNMDSQADSEVFSQYSDGSIPTLVFGCKYYRVGSGEAGGEEKETKDLTAMLCKLTDNKPSEICSSVQDLVNQIK